MTWRRLRIFLVEDDDAVRDSLQIMLEARGYAVDAFVSSEELLERGDMRSCNCLILDVNLPGLNGLDLLARLRALGFKTPAIYLTGREEAGARLRAGELGAAAFLGKPVDRKSLIDSIVRAVNREALGGPK